MKKIIKNVHPTKIIQTEINHKNNQLAESITSLGNGYMGCRGNYEEYYTGDSLKGTYIAGVWVPDKTRVGWWKNGYPNYYGKVINAPDFLSFNLILNGEQFDLAKANILSFYREIDMMTGIMRRKMTIQTKDGSFEIESSRLFSIARKEIAVLSYTFRSIDFRGDVKIQTGLSAEISNRDANYGEQFWKIVENSVSPAPMLTVRTMKNEFGIEQFSVCLQSLIQVHSQTAETQAEDYQDERKCGKSIQFTANPGSITTIEKITAIVTSRDYKENELSASASTLCTEAQDIGIEALFREQANAWAKRWEMCDIVIDGDDEAQQGIRFDLFQIWSTYDGADARLNVGPKGFTGEKYGGATYYDTEGYCVPMYLAVAGPDVARQLLIFRYNTLEKAKENAAKIGMKGALYPMVTFTGEECHNEWEITFEELHRNAAVIYAIYCYTKYTGDESYIRDYGLDIMVEVSRFWVSRCNYNPRKDCYMLLGISAPNEYENNVNNNWLTNFMAKWCLEYTLENIEKFGYTISDAEKEKFADVASKMYPGEVLDNGVIVQQDGFMDKELLPVSAIPEDELPLCKHWSWDHILRSCYIKQADVLLAFYYFPDAFSEEQKKVNFEFYEPMTVHESSLSPSMHSIVASQFGNVKEAYRLFLRACRLDLDNYNSDTEDGLHITSMGGAWLAVTCGFAGMNFHKDNLLKFNPHCPENWEKVAFKIKYRERLLAISFDKKYFECEILKGEPLTISVNEKSYNFETKLTVEL